MAHGQPELERERVLCLLRVDQQARYPGQPPCHYCSYLGAQVACRHCQAAFHGLCLSPPLVGMAVLDFTAVPRDATWRCRACGQASRVGAPPVAQKPEEVQQKLLGARLGLTPEWLIQAAIHEVLQLPRPTAERPTVPGLLDPCTNSRTEPNIPAARLYDEAANGLSRNNPWRGYRVLLNPPYESAVQWRFVNRAIDEVEAGEVPAVLLVCRNATDSQYFQRLRPYPRVHLRRNSALFKDYSNTTKGFGITLVCLASPQAYEQDWGPPPGTQPGAWEAAMQACAPGDTISRLYRRFVAAFQDYGEPNMPVDAEVMQSPAFAALLARLTEYTRRHFRDHWLGCAACPRWRLVTWQEVQAAEASNEPWTCSMLNPPWTSCDTPLTEVETNGPAYTSRRQARLKNRPQDLAAAEVWLAGRFHDATEGYQSGAAPLDGGGFKLTEGHQSRASPLDGSCWNTVAGCGAAEADGQAGRFQSVVESSDRSKREACRLQGQSREYEAPAGARSSEVLRQEISLQLKLADGVI